MVVTKLVVFRTADYHADRSSETLMVTLMSMAAAFQSGSTAAMVGGILYDTYGDELHAFCTYTYMETALVELRARGSEPLVRTVILTDNGATDSYVPSADGQDLNVTVHPDSILGALSDVADLAKKVYGMFL